MLTKLRVWLYVMLCWITGRGPWIVVGQYHDDEGRMCRFRTGVGDRFGGFAFDTFGTLDDANDYCASRNEDAIRDPLGTTYYVWHLLEFNHFPNRENS